MLDNTDKNNTHSTSSTNDEYIELTNVSTNNLNHLNIKIPLNKITVVTGVSGSGKSSLVFDTIHAEAYRRYVESLSSFARQYLKAIPKPKLDRALNLPASIAVQQVKSSTNSRSTVGTTTELIDLVRIVFTYRSDILCPNCNKIVKIDTPRSICTNLYSEYSNLKIHILSSLSVFNMNPKELKSQLLSQGFSKVFYDNNFYQLEDIKDKDLSKYSVLIDRMRLTDERKKRVEEALSLALKLSKKRVSVLVETSESSSIILNFSSSLVCPDCNKEFRRPSVGLFSFNNPYGACPQCQGFGYEDNFDWKEFFASKYRNYRKKSSGSNVKPINLSPYKRTYTLCSVCHGTRLKEESLYYKVYNENIHEVSQKSIEELGSWFLSIEKEASAIQDKKLLFDSSLSSMGLDEAIAEAKSRIKYLEKIGVGYLSLDRLTRSLSGGERQRINMARCLGSNLTDVMYCLDEPSQGLHPLDSNNLISVLNDFKNNSNTVIVVEHERSIIEAADNIIEIGPGAGHLGGDIVYEGGFPKDKDKDSIKKERHLSRFSWEPTSNLEQSSTLSLDKNQKFLTLSKVRTNNLKGISVHFPLNKITTVCGISGSGKTSLIEQSLYPVLSKCFHTQPKGEYNPQVESISSIEDIEKYKGVIHVTQSPMVRSSRSNIGTYLGVLDEIKKIYASQPLAKKYQLSSSSFSFNTVGGRCETCKGLGTIEEDLSFLGEIDIICPSCHGDRFSSQVLEVKYKEKNFIDILNLTILEAYSFFSDNKKISSILKRIIDFGLSYLRLGQNSSSFSGGEAQRVKLLKMILENKNKDSYFLIFDEPTTGLSCSDVATLIKEFKELSKNNTIIIVEHHTDIIKASDWVIELGPGAAHRGGDLVFEGTVENLKKSSNSLISKFL